jgi:prepilin-type N-terminal cleavage/methylation domain-containing protein
MKKYLIAFTLIELLVVIAIIGILSGLIIVGMNGMSQKATLAKAQVFSNSLRNSLLMNLISEWKFDQIIPTDQTPDSWSGANICTLKQNGYASACDTTHCPQLQTTDCVYGSCLSFDGLDDYVDCGSGTSLDITGNKITIEVWAKPSSLAEEYFVAKFPGDTVTSGYNFFITSLNIYFRLGDGTSRFQLSASHGLSANVWYHLVATYNGALMKIYKNGVAFSGSTSFTGNIGTNANPVIIGERNTSSSYFFNGSIDNVRIYDVAIPASQIKEQYYAGLNNLLASGSISIKEYQSRLLTISKN